MVYRSRVGKEAMEGEQAKILTADYLNLLTIGKEGGSQERAFIQ